MNLNQNQLMPEIQGQSLLQSIIEGIQEKKGNNVVSLSFEKLDNAVAKHFVITDAESNTQIKAIADSIEEFTQKNNQTKSWSKEGIEGAEWIILDYADVVVHVFQSDVRQKYSLEELWADAELCQYS